MKFGIRQAVDLTDSDKYLTGVSCPVELALSHKLSDYLQQRSGLPDIVKYIKDHNIPVLTVHATQGHLTDRNFQEWAYENVRFAESVGAGSIVFHPENCASPRKADLQLLALRNLALLQKSTAVTVAIETFSSKKRVLTPEEIIEHQLPMVLDTSHLPKQRTMRIISAYVHGIVGVHLSEARYDEIEGKENPHQPVQDFGFRVLDNLAEKNWDGTVILEYLPWHHSRLLPDWKMLVQRYGRPE